MWCVCVYNGEGKTKFVMHCLDVQVVFFFRVMAIGIAHMMDGRLSGMEWVTKGIDLYLS